MAREPFFHGVRIDDFPAPHFDPSEYDATIEEHGADIELRRAVFCPCARIEDHRPRGTCEICKGLGYVYPESMREVTRALLATRSPRKTPEGAGSYVVGTIWISFRLGYVPGDGDLILPDGEEHVVHQTIFRSSLQVSTASAWARTTAHDQVPPRLAPAQDRLLYPDPTVIERILWKEGEELRTAGFNDYRIDGDRVVWAGSRAPEPGKAYTVRYRARAAYQLQPSEPLYRMEADGGLPYRCSAVRLDRAGWPDPRDL